MRNWRCRYSWESMARRDIDVGIRTQPKAQFDPCAGVRGARSGDHGDLLAMRMASMKHGESDHTRARCGAPEGQ